MSEPHKVAWQNKESGIPKQLRAGANRPPLSGKSKLNMIGLLVSPTTPYIFDEMSGTKDCDDQSATWFPWHA